MQATPSQLLRNSAKYASPTSSSNGHTPSAVLIRASRSASDWMTGWCRAALCQGWFRCRSGGRTAARARALPFRRSSFPSRRFLRLASGSVVECNYIGRLCPLVRDCSQFDKRLCAEMSPKGNCTGGDPGLDWHPLRGPRMLWGLLWVISVKTPTILVAFGSGQERRIEPATGAPAAARRGMVILSDGDGT